MDFPPTAMRPEIMMALSRANFVGEGERVDRSIEPFADQLEIRPGDYAIIANSTSRLDEDFTMVQILDASEYATPFPDWQARLDKKYLLCEYRSNKQNDPNIGWFARVRMVKVSEEEFEIIQGWFRNKDLPPVPPEWFRDKLVDYANKLSEVSPSTVPRRVQCDNCGSYEVHLHSVHTTRSAMIAGQVEHEGQTKYTAISDMQSRCVTEAHLHCTDCEHRAELDESQYGFEEH